ncbi:putative pentatricopeptide repeat-containing protein At1g64310 [Nicotiana tabacum]|uniref:Pentatricopeptide repeat-containing protein At1g64310 n=2 Tax=Nicotiana tabacum TaxID=4097 RepID=A0A1S4B0J7_TOBAC|nr:putative pentatricopeptide repeat-containing protein At1g64310 [Nicotiana tomentosiformis]XP_016482469.1 PREDICTED: putative pentatricopeptide repeat-containing protein At1g64310 [Nicotiana tabacum]XP_016482470.1 PREDICTED: putative pentatricopeptide repeat-containing protein At1g64310 [Nicotiana tabacum]XP_018627628.1 putative pentatricopeptide repeat-containing protein At1g64310 [Nicotiana tomentosiformis]XP_018627629.1 putative pentatricopeptide repeat-containing protein At1g64310 [Nicoti
MFIPFHSLLSQLSKLKLTISRTKELHAFVIRTHLSRDPFYATRVLRFYAINDDIISARNLFDKTPQRSIYLWNSLIRAYASAHKFTDAFFLFKDMLYSEIKPDNFTFACVVRASSENFDVHSLRVLHGAIFLSGLHWDFICSSQLVSAYSRLGCIADASKVFSGITDPDLVLWNSMISGYGCLGELEKGLELFSRMQKMGLRPDEYTMVGLIKAIYDPSVLEIGESIHAFCLKLGVESNSHITSLLVSMYSRCKCMGLAFRVFECRVEPDLVTWSAIISGTSLCGNSVKALDFFREMNMKGRKADPPLIATVLTACSQLATVQPGSEIHGYAFRHGYHMEVMVSSALVDMYSKCGFLELGYQVYKTMTFKNIVSINSIISSLGLYGLASQAFQIFEKALVEGHKPDEATFSALLCACCHAGLVNDGRKYFRRMKDQFGIPANTEHYIYMVKLLGMEGQLREAYELIVQSLQEPVDSGIWGALLSCCDAHRNYELADIVASHLFGNKLENSRYKIMLANMYASDGRWDLVNKLRVDLESKELKHPGKSWITSTKPFP